MILRILRTAAVLVASALLLCLIVACAYWLGHSDGQDVVRHHALDVGAAKMMLDRDGDPQLYWQLPPPELPVYLLTEKGEQP